MSSDRSLSDLRLSYYTTADTGRTFRPTSAEKRGKGDELSEVQESVVAQEVFSDEADTAEMAGETEKPSTTDAELVTIGSERDPGGGRKLVSYKWCAGGDSNPHRFPHWNLNPARIPIPPPARSDEGFYTCFAYG